MNIQGKRVLILGGAGMVGMAVAREILKETPARVVIHSLRESEAAEAVAGLIQERDRLQARADLFPDSPQPGGVSLLADFGNLFVRLGLQQREPATLMADAESRRTIIEDLIGEFGEEEAHRFFLYDLIARHRPDLVVDTVNTATGIAYGDLYTVSSEAYAAVRRADSADDPARALDHLKELTERLIATQYVPQLVRHVQVLWKAMKDAQTAFYVKVGTSGTGGMGLNIPYTHGEEKPSRMLLSKSAVAGAHTLLLFLQARTPDSPITKEIKPAAAIAWKRFGYGEVMRRGRPIILEDATVIEPELLLPTTASAHSSAEVAGKEAGATRFAGVAPASVRASSGGNGADGETLKAVYVDTGENGLFSVDEFVAISTVGQMEFVTPEEIARNLIAEVCGANTGKDVIDALNIACMGPTYRAGFVRNYLLDKLRRLQDELELKDNGTLAMAFEVLGPPRLSKLLYEAYLLKLAYGTVEAASAADPARMSADVAGLVGCNPALRKKIVSIGIPILMESDGRLRLLRGRDVAIPRKLAIDLADPGAFETWAEAGWVDLRRANMAKWSQRLSALQREIALIPATDSSSRYVRDRDFWGGAAGESPIDPGEIVGWLFNTEDRGERGRD
jgi:NAD(P)-dependent dehydrogenase (short-subunit alcohol dehydrogenase family)